MARSIKLPMAAAPAAAPAPIGNVPPPDAPREVSQPITPAAQAEMIAKARAHAGQQSPEAAATIAGRRVSEMSASPSSRPVRPPVESAAPVDGMADSTIPVEESIPSTPLGMSPHALPALPPDATAEEIADPVVNSRPTRGQPHPVADPNLQIGGGFAIPGMEVHGPSQPNQPSGGFGLSSGEYLALDGAELKEMILGLMDQLVPIIQQDLRLSIAVTYPLVTATVTVRVERGDQPDQTFEIVVRHKEADGRPPDLVREELGLPVPHKQMIMAPGGPIVVDRLI